jgi:hypothetical protein
MNEYEYFLTFLKMYKLAGWAITELPVKILAYREGVQQLKQEIILCKLSQEFCK